MYTIHYDPKLDLLDISWSGLFTVEDMSKYTDDCRACWKREGFRDGYRLRIVLSDDQPLPQDTLAVLSGAFADFPKSGRKAMVTASAIARLQIKRVMMQPNTEIFDNPEAALDWLMESSSSQPSSEGMESR